MCFLRDLSGSIAQACGNDAAVGVGIYTPIGAESIYAGILPPEFVLLAQRGEDFGERLAFAAEDLFRVGFESVCLINSDSPTVPGASFVEAVAKLREPGDRVVLGPSDDGGYYLIGLKQLHREMFERIDWSTERVLEQTKQRAAELNLAVHELLLGFDIDDRAGVARLCRELLSDGASQDVAPNTVRFLKQVIEREGRIRIWPDKQ